MNKKNKKGFTLIEMLVVIAIIAILVAIIIPTVSKATTKAKAATDAANLRSVLAEASIDYLSGVSDSTGMVHWDAENKQFSLGTNPPVCKTYTQSAALTVSVSNGVVTAQFGGHTIAELAGIAETGKLGG